MYYRTDKKMASKMLESLTKTLKKIQMEIAAEKTIWMHIGAKDKQEILKAEEMYIRRVPATIYLGIIISGNGKHGLVIKCKLQRPKKPLIGLRPLLKTWRLSVDLKAKLVETFIQPIVTYGLTPIVLRKRDKQQLAALQNTARRMIQRLTSKRDKRTEQLKKRNPHDSSDLTPPKTSTQPMVAT